MARVKKGVTKLARHKKILKKVKGYRWSRKTRVRIAQEAILHAEKFRYRDRRAIKREMRGLWQVRLNAALRPLGMSYSRFIAALKAKKVELDRKVLSEIAAKHPEVFAKIVAAVKPVKTAKTAAEAATEKKASTDGVAKKKAPAVAAKKKA